MEIYNVEDTVFIIMSPKFPGQIRYSDGSMGYTKSDFDPNKGKITTTIPNNMKALLFKAIFVMYNNPIWAMSKETLDMLVEIIKS